MLPRFKYGPNASPACITTEAFCRISGIPYDVDLSVKSQGPAGRWPFISHRGEYIADSHNIIRYLTREYNIKSEMNWTEKEEALATLITRTLDDSVYLGLLRHRWVDNLPMLMQLYDFPGVPNFLKNILMKMGRKKIINMLNEVGEGDRTNAEYLEALVQDFRAVVTFLPDPAAPSEGVTLPPTCGPFIFGAQPTSLDCRIFAFLFGGSLDCFGAPEYTKFLHESKKVKAYMDAMKKAAFPDWDVLCAT